MGLPVVGEGAGLVKLPVHGFVLAGGKSSRMGADKATLEFRGRPMVEIAVEKLREFCADVSIVGNREDLSGFAEVVREERVDCGPAAGIEAGLKAARQEWVMFVPVDVPLVPSTLLRRWVACATETQASGGVGSYLHVGGKEEPAFCLLRSTTVAAVSYALDGGNRRLRQIWREVERQMPDGFFWMPDAEEFADRVSPSAEDVRQWFANVNTPEELAGAEAWAAEVERVR